MAVADSFMAAFLGRSGRRGLGDFFVGSAVVEDVDGFVVCASPSLRLTLEEGLAAPFCVCVCCDFVSEGERKSAEIDVSGTGEFRGAG